jgi:alkanesulfonate monooxygenase SsuD/methylene tetrahydromethanopterin reductase-like flavin-dependent oxidoreductase (luciferase family)
MHGTPEEVVERIQRYEEELGISGLVLEMNFGGQIPNELVLNSIRQLTEKVMPEFK